MVFEKNAVYPVSALQRNSREVRDAAKEKLLRITENGASAYIFCSEEVLERTINQAVEEALYERECLEAIERGDCMCGLDNLTKARDGRAQFRGICRQKVDRLGRQCGWIDSGGGRRRHADARGG